MSIKESSLNVQVKCLIYRSMHTALKETDLLLGFFARHFLPTASEEECALYARFLEETNLDIYQWISGQKPFPSDYDVPFFQPLKPPIASL